MKTEAYKKHWTVITYSGGGDWEDQSDEIGSFNVADDSARKMAAASKDGRFVVMEHTALRAYARSTKIQAVTA